MALNPDGAYTRGITLRPLHGQLEIESAWCDYAGKYAGHLYFAVQILNAMVYFDVVVVDFPSPDLYRILQPIVQGFLDRSALKTHIKIPVERQQNSVRSAAPSP